MSRKGGVLRFKSGRLCEFSLSPLRSDCIKKIHFMDREVYRVNPFESPLWAHLEEIRQLRKARLTWTGIARHFAETHRIRRTPVAIYRFYKRAASKPKPLGFDETGPLRSRPSTTQEPTGNRSSV